LQVIFRKRATNYRALLRKMTYDDKASYDSTPPCHTTVRRILSPGNVHSCDSVAEREGGGRRACVLVRENEVERMSLVLSTLPETLWGGYDE